MNTTQDYIVDFLARLPVSHLGIIHYGTAQGIPANAKIIIIPAVTNFCITSLPVTPFTSIDGIPILYGDARIERQNGIIIIYADIIASSFFLLSRYEEKLKPKCRDQHGRFTAKDSVIFQQGYGYRPLVDEYGELLRKWLREAGVDTPGEKKGFSKIYLTHDVDEPFRFSHFETVCKQYIKNLIQYNYSSSPLKKYFNEQYDEYNTFVKIINYDKAVSVETIYFLITAGSFFCRKYYNFSSKKIKRLICFLKNSQAKFGIHLSHEAGNKPKRIRTEVQRFTEKFEVDKLFSRHHYLKWCEPEDVEYMGQAEITDDFTLSYADSIGFRVGTCRPYRFISPQTKKLTNVTIHPLEIMECTLNRQSYMHLDYEEAFSKCKEIIDQVYKHNGELVLLWHNTEFMGQNYQEKLYKEVLDHIKGLC
jgi:hypothetical protein